MGAIVETVLRRLVAPTSHYELFVNRIPPPSSFNYEHQLEVCLQEVLRSRPQIICTWRHHAFPLVRLGPQVIAAVYIMSASCWGGVFLRRIRLR